MTTPAPQPAPTRRGSALVIGLSVASIVITVAGVAMVGGWTAFSSIEGNSSAGWLLLLLVPLAWLGTLLGFLLGVVALIVAIVKKAPIVLAAVAVVVSISAIVAGVAFGYFEFITSFI